MKKLVSLFLVFAMCLALCVSNAMFQDTKGHWASEYINALAMEGVINGITDDNFAPDTLVTREQFLKMLLLSTSGSINERVSYENPPEINTIIEKSPFSDVSADRWSYYYIKNAVGNIIYKEDYDGCFEPVKDITREEAAVWMARALSLKKGEASFADNDQIKDKALVGAAMKAGLIAGFGDGTFRPEGALTRAEAATMLKRAGAYNAKSIMEEMTDEYVLSICDLNADGTDEEIKIHTDGSKYVISVGESAVVGGECDTEALEHYLVDIDKTDEYIEIAMVESEYGIGALAIYRYTGSALYLMGYIESVGGINLKADGGSLGDDWGVACVNGDGTITANIGEQYVHTMLVRKQFIVNGKKRLVTKNDEFYTVGEYSDFTCQVALTSTKEDENHPSISINPGYAGKIVKTDLKNWIYIELGGGNAGWIYVEDDCLIAGEPLSHYLEGLWYAG